MESNPASEGGVYGSFLATQARLDILRRLTLEFAGVTLEEIPTKNPDDFQVGIRLGFASEDQIEPFYARMFSLHRQDSANKLEPPATG
ncbi:MAG TPA: hypothetical protein VFP32_02430 [Candidatus Saccharimonadales bacterium]|nr:hypothetical protein [Candidatus Saccharimonadales bacterium]